MIGGIARQAEGIAEELRQRLPSQRKTQRGKLALLVATMLHARTANLMALAASLPLDTERADMRYQWIARFIDNEHVLCDAVIEPFAREVIAKAAEAGRVTLIMDQSKASDRHQILMLSLRFGERALPLAWRVEATEGAIGFGCQKGLARRHHALASARCRHLPDGGPVLRNARFDRVRNRPRMGLQATSEGQSDGVHRRAEIAPRPTQRS
jgi:hypothetical protein